MKKTIFCTMLLALAAGGLSAQSLIFVGNTGYLLDTGSKKILFDSPFVRGGEWGIIMPSSATRDAITKARPPFNNLDLILISHNHEDHFNTGRLTDCLAVNPKAALIAPPDVLARVRRMGEPKGLKNKLIAPVKKAGARAAVEVNGVTLTVFGGKHHYPDKYQVLHYAFLVKAGGKTVFHSSAWTGDHPGDRDLGLKSGHTPMDVALIHYFMIDTNIYGGNDAPEKVKQRRKIITDQLRPRALVLHHVYNAGGTVPRLRRLAETLKGNFPGITVPEKSLEKIPF